MASAYALIAFFGLTGIHVSAAILYKYSQSGGKYEYSPATTLVLAEVFKILLSLSLHCMSTWQIDRRLSLFEQLFIGVKYALSDAWKQLNARILGQLASLALSYAVYNQCQFLVFMWADAASVILLRSSGSFVAAVMAYFLLQRMIVGLQWLNIVLQVFGLILVQYDACKAQTVLPPVLYFVLFLHVSLSSFNSIWNEHLVKSKDAPSLNVQNACLYFFGAIFNFAAYLLLPSSLYGSTSQSTGFFHGYSFITILIVALNSVIGLAITAVYKYADVIIKTFSLACATGTLFIFDYLFFGRAITLNVLLGILVVYGASYLYFISAPKSTLPAPSTGPSSSPASSDSPLRDTSSPRSSATSAKRSIASLLVPEFLVIKAPPKTTLLAFLVTFFIIGAYVATHTSDLKPIHVADEKDIIPISSIIPFKFEKPGKYNASRVEQVVWTPEEDVKPRFFEPSNNLDRLLLMWRSQRAGVKGPNYEMAVCFYGATSETLKTAMRWNAELDISTYSSFDKFVMQGDASKMVSYDAIFDPVAYINAPYKPNEYLEEVKGRLKEDCTLDSFSKMVHSISTCAELLEYHTQRHGLTYRWAWITDPNVSWNDDLGATPIDPIAAKPFLPDFKTLDPPTNSVFVRDYLESRSTHRSLMAMDITEGNNDLPILNGHPLSSDALPDPASILGSYKSVIDFSRSLKQRTDLLAKANTPSDPLISPGTQTKASTQVMALNFAPVIRSAAESIGMSFVTAEFLPPRNASSIC